MFLWKISMYKNVHENVKMYKISEVKFSLKYSQGETNFYLNSNRIYKNIILRKHPQFIN